MERRCAGPCWCKFLLPLGSSVAVGFIGRIPVFDRSACFVVWFTVCTAARSEIRIACKWEFSVWHPDSCHIVTIAIVNPAPMVSHALFKNDDSALRLLLQIQHDIVHHFSMAVAIRVYLQLLYFLESGHLAVTRCCLS